MRICSHNTDLIVSLRRQESGVYVDASMESIYLFHLSYQTWTQLDYNMGKKHQTLWVPPRYYYQMEKTPQNIWVALTQLSAEQLYDLFFEGQNVKGGNMGSDLYMMGQRELSMVDQELSKRHNTPLSLTGTEMYLLQKYKEHTEDLIKQINATDYPDVDQILYEWMQYSAREAEVISLLIDAL